MKMGYWIIAAQLTFGRAAIARADQCELLDDSEIALRAARILEPRGATIATLCQPCGELAPGAPVAVTSVAVQRRGGGWAVEINGTPVDLAYVYVRTSPRRYDNLAVLAGCSASGVSPGLTVTDATSNGVLIRADWSPVMQSTAAFVEPAERLRDEPHHGHMGEPPAHRPGLLSGWIAATLLLSGAASTMLLAAVLHQRRRRVHHLPRALDLMPAKDVDRDRDAAADTGRSRC
jgi:hypothetical protein